MKAIVQLQLPPLEAEVNTHRQNAHLVSFWDSFSQTLTSDDILITATTATIPALLVKPNP
jgi:hypothetical protein